MTALNDDLEAIDRYMKTTPLYTPEAKRLRDEWIGWYDNLGWYEKAFDSDLFNLARNKKNALNLANARSRLEKEEIQTQLKTAVTSEELRGEPRRMLSDGTYGSTEAPEPFFPLRVKIVAGIAAVGALALLMVKKIYVDPFIPRKR
jgi:hypothetical protein